MKTLEKIVKSSLVTLGLGIGILGSNDYVNAESKAAVVNGMVYSGATIFTQVVPNVKVDVTCNGYTLSDTTGIDGFYAVKYDSNLVSLGDSVKVCVGDLPCAKKAIEDELPQFYLLGIDLFNISGETPAERTTWGRIKTLYR